MKIKSQYKRSRDCIYLSRHRGKCPKCGLYDGMYSHCKGYDVQYDSVKMKKIIELANKSD